MGGSSLSYISHFITLSPLKYNTFLCPLRVAFAKCGIYMK